MIKDDLQPNKMGETMFDDKFFDDWLDGQAQKVMEKVASGEGIAPEQMMILMLKAQTNHFAHLDVDLRSDMQNLDSRLSSEMQKMNERLSGEMRRLSGEMRELREDMDKRFEQVDKRFEQLTSRIDHFMIWSFATTISVGGIIIAAIKFF